MNAQSEQVARLPITRQNHSCETGSILSVASILAILLSSTANAGHSDRQTFSVFVPVSANLSTPGDSVHLDEVENGTNDFPEQAWSLESNSPTGLVADFTVEEGFVHQIDPAIRHDAKLSVRINQATGKAQWFATKGEDTTAKDAGDHQAGVQVQSNAAGQADIALQVSLQSNDEVIVPGSYSTTVTCTIAMP